MRKLIGICLISLTLPALADTSTSFSGSWYIDLRSPAQAKAGVECGGAGLTLQQAGSSISGTHNYATAGCGRLDEAGEVTGTVSGNEAILEITSSRNGAVVRGKARLVEGNLYWEALEVVRQGEPAYDELILQRGILSPERAP